jgi:tetraacyldisaccharide 4'-kinase
MTFLRIILLPTVPVYALLIRVRNFLFDKKIFKSKKVKGRIISVGNITVGGSGKTPATIYITELLKKKGINVGVLSRGYRRKSRGYVLVSDGKDILAPVDKSGDEMYHTVLDCKAPAAVCENRVLGAKRLINDTGVNTIVLDDAFQHRWIYRDLDIVVIEQRFLTDENFLVKSLLLSGTMREPLSSLRRADAAIINRKFTTLKDIPEKFSKYFSDIKVFNGFYEAVGFYDLKSNTQFGLNEFEGQKSLVVSGIAKPYSFLNVLSQTKVDTENRLIFRDHKHYTHKDIQMIRKAFYSTNSHSVVTTEKDAVKLTDFSKELDDIDIYFLKIKFKMDDEESFKGFIFRA